MSDATLWAEPHVQARLTASRLRNRLRLNAMVSLASGAATILLAPSIARAVGVDRSDLVRVVGVGLVAFAVDLVVVAGFRRRRLLAAAGAVIAADTLWVAATGVVLVTATIPAAGEVLLAATAVLVGALAVVQGRAWVTARAAGDGLDADLDESPPIEAMKITRITTSPPDSLWAAVADHELFGRLALNLDHIEVAGDGMARRCVARDGKSWAETCQVLEEGRRHVVEVDTADYPYPLQLVSCLCFIQPIDSDRSTVGLVFQLRPDRGLLGRVAALVLPAGRPVFARIVRGWEVAAGSALAPSQS